MVHRVGNIMAEIEDFAKCINCGAGTWQFIARDVTTQYVSLSCVCCEHHEIAKPDLYDKLVRLGFILNPTEETDAALQKLRDKLTGVTDVVNHPDHYTMHPSGVECIAITRWMTFNLGNVVKYIWRAGLKNEDENSSLINKHIEDLEKAQWYLADEIARLKKIS